MFLFSPCHIFISSAADNFEIVIKVALLLALHLLTSDVKILSPNVCVWLGVSHTAFEKVFI